jgi:hypothetical protein
MTDFMCILTENDLTVGVSGAKQALEKKARIKHKSREVPYALDDD